MSTDYAPLNKILLKELLDGRLETYGVREHVVPQETTDRRRCLTDGNNFMWVYAGEDGFIVCLTRYASGGAPGKILNAVAEACDTDIVSEYQPQFWGFETQEEWDTAMDEMGKKHKEEFYTKIMKYLGGEANEFSAGTIGAIKAEVAKELTAQDPALLLLENKDKLLSEIEREYRQRHAVVITLSPEEMAAAAMSVTHEDDLPRA